MPGKVEGDERIRLFCALRLPDATLDAISAWQDRWIPDLPWLRPVPRENLHVTLAFLGHRPVDEVPAILEALRASTSQFSRVVLEVRKYRETPRVGMLAMEDALQRPLSAEIAYDLHDRLEKLGIPLRERYPFRPHVTVVRFRERPRLQAEALAGQIVLSDAALYHSALRSAGAQYEVLESVALGGR